jgi:hypothetical protein
MKATDLRIGNLILKNNEIYEISSLFFVDLHDGTIRENNNYVVKPIPLTQEWLLKFGFEVYEFNDKENQYGFKDRLIVIRDGLFCDYGSSVIIKHVHQLQNLYFALTGTELIEK